jgi:hypothetical protein
MKLKIDKIMEEEVEILQSIYFDEIVSIDLKWYLFLQI